MSGEIVAVLFGQPNAGKSSLLNALAGTRAVVSNYPGTTVEVTRATVRLYDLKITLLDTPGVYSLSDSSEDERVAKLTLLREDYDVVVNLVDATALERSLYLTLQLREAGVRMVVALNFIEEAKRRGITVDPDELSRRLGVPVVPINPLTGRGLARLAATLVEAASGPGEVRPMMLRYDDHIEEAISAVASAVSGGRFPRRFLAIRLLEGDVDVAEAEGVNAAEILPPDVVEHHGDLARDIMLTRHGYAALIAAACSRIERVRAGAGRPTLAERVDRVLLNPRYGWLANLSMLGAALYLLTVVGGATQDLLSGLADAALEAAGGLLSGAGWWADLVRAALTGTAAGVGIAVSYVFLFYLILGTLEDVGILPRTVLSLSRIMGRLGLPGRAAIPLLLGAGCSVPALKATRILPSKRARMRTAAGLVGVPCSSRSAIILGLVAAYAGAVPAAAVYAISVASGLAMAWASSLLLGEEPSPLLVELPPYRRPLLSNVLAKSWLRMRDFVYLVIPLLFLGGMGYELAAEAGLVSAVVGPLRPLTEGWLLLPAGAAVPLVFGFLQKDLTVGMLAVAAGAVGMGSYMTPTQVVTFGIASTIQIPCVIAFGTACHELGCRFTVALEAAALGWGILVAGVVARLAPAIGL